jgi:hypothetical protein
MSDRSLVLPVSVGVIGLALIGLGQAVPNRHSIEDDLAARSTKALAAAELTGATVSFTGRDATITNLPQNNEATALKAVKVVESVKGVRTAGASTVSSGPGAPTPGPTMSPLAGAGDSPSATPEATATTAEPTITVEPTATAKPVDFPVGFTLADGTITVTGTVRSKAAATDLITATKAAGRGWKVVDKTTLDPGLTTASPKADKLPALTRLLAKAPLHGSTLVIQYKADQVILRGTPATAKAESSLLKAAAATVSGKSKVFDGLDVP